MLMMLLAGHWRYYGRAEGGDAPPPKTPGEARGGASGLVAGRTPADTMGHAMLTLSTRLQLAS